MADDFNLKSVFATPDGQQFETKAEAIEHMRRPQVVAALNEVIDDNAELVDWMADNREAIADAFDAGSIKRVSKSERKQLEKALEAVKAAEEPKFRFITENADAILTTFRWPSQKRLTDEEKTVAVKEELTNLADNNEEVADFIIDNKDSLLSAFEAGKVKREMSPKVREGLAKYQEEQKRKKEAAAAAEEAPAKTAPKKTK